MRPHPKERLLPTGTVKLVIDLREGSRGGGAVSAVIREGMGQMPSFAHLSSDEIEALLAYLGYVENTDVDPSPSTADRRTSSLNAGEILWQVPLGEHRALSERGHPQTGTENFGGSIVTAGGLLFIAATRDEKLRAFDSSSGRVLWEAALPAGGYATPSTYEIDGRQYVVIAAGGGGKLGTRSGDYHVAFALEGPMESTPPKRGSSR